MRSPFCLSLRVAVPPLIIFEPTGTFHEIKQGHTIEGDLKASIF